MSNVISIPQYVLNYNSYLNINLAAHAPCFDRRTCVFCFEKKNLSFEELDSINQCLVCVFRR